VESILKPSSETRLIGSETAKEIFSKVMICTSVTILHRRGINANLSRPELAFHPIVSGSGPLRSCRSFVFLILFPDSDFRLELYKSGPS
jgi:hypothetical protein